MVIRFFALNKLLPVFFLMGLVLPVCANVVTVSKECGERFDCYQTVGEALEQTPAKSGDLRINIEEGRYYEKIIIDRSNVEIVGSGVDKTELHFDLSAQAAKKLYAKGTSGSASVVVKGKGVTFRDITLSNSFDYLKNDALPKNHPDKIKSAQAVAVLLEKGSDKVFFNRVKMKGYQDTFYADGGRAYVYDSTIYGNVDFIFGSGQVLIEKSDIIAVERAKAFSPGDIHGHITAASTQLRDPFGFVFLNCRLLREENVPDNSYSLGRPWHPTVTFDDGRYADPEAVGSVIYINTFMDAHIVNYGWESMGGTPKHGKKKTIFKPEDARFYEVKSYGPGASLQPSRKQWNDSFKSSQILKEWKPKINE